MNTPKPASSRLVRGLTLTGLLLLLILLWWQQADLARLRDDNDRLQAQNLALLNNTVQLQPSVTNPVPAALPESMPDASRPLVALPATPHPEPPERNRLLFEGADVTQTPTGLVAILRFKAAHTGPLGLVGMSVRLPSNIPATIQSLNSAGTARFEDGESTVSESGRFAFFHGTLGDEREVRIALGVSGSTEAYIKGSAGIGFFRLDIQSTNATAVKQ